MRALLGSSAGAAMRRVLAIVVLSVLARTAGAIALEGDFGSAWNFHTPLTIVQAGQPTLDFSAAYDTNPFQSPPYYWIRTDFFTHGKWWASFTHHKLYLGNPPPEVQHFEVTHGYNLLSLSRLFDLWLVEVEVGASLVVAHPHTIIRGLENRDGYNLVGGGGLVGVGQRFTIIGPLYVRVEGVLTGNWARIPVAQGHADTPNVALHGIVGLGLDLL